MNTLLAPRAPARLAPPVHPGGGAAHCPCWVRVELVREAAAGPFRAPALRRPADAAAMVLAHNHPSGNPAPSLDDLTVTLRMVRAGGLLGIPLRDHLIVGAGRWTSLRRRHPELWAEVTVA